MVYGNIVTGLSLQRPGKPIDFCEGFGPRVVHMGCVVDRVALGQIFLQVFPSLSVIIILPVLHTFHSSTTSMTQS